LTPAVRFEGKNTPNSISAGELTEGEWKIGEEDGKGEREGVKGKERQKGGKEGGHSLIFTWIYATVCGVVKMRDAKMHE